MVLSNLIRKVFKWYWFKVEFDISVWSSLGVSSNGDGYSVEVEHCILATLYVELKRIE